jgi:hypothetical protein
MFMAYCRRSQCCPHGASLVQVCDGLRAHTAGNADGICRQCAASSIPFSACASLLSRSYRHVRVGHMRLPGQHPANASSAPSGRHPRAGRRPLATEVPYLCARRATLPVNRYRRMSALRLLAAPPRGEMRIQGPPQHGAGQFTGRCRLCTARQFARLCWVRR